MRAERYWFVAVVGIGVMACSPRARECLVNTESAELELLATRRFAVQVERPYPIARSDSIVMTLSRDSVVRDTVFGHAAGQLTDLGVDVGPDSLPSRPYFALCRGDSIFVTLDPRIVDKELWLRGARVRPIRGTWSTAGFPQVEGEFLYRPSN